MNFSEMVMNLYWQVNSKVTQLGKDFHKIGRWEVTDVNTKAMHLEDILSFMTLIKEDINFWKEDLTAEKDKTEVEKWNLFIALIKSLGEKSNEITR